MLKKLKQILRIHSIEFILAFLIIDVIITGVLLWYYVFYL
jgi:hypothetical protein